MISPRCRRAHAAAPHRETRLSAIVRPAPMRRARIRASSCSRPRCCCSTARCASSTRIRRRRTCSSCRKQAAHRPARSRDVFGDAPALVAAIDKAVRERRVVHRAGARARASPASRSCISPARCRRSKCTTATLLLEFRHIDQQLKIAREERLLEQQQANRELIRSLAHEIKNPLGGIRGAAQLLERELDRAAADRVHAGDHRRGRPPAVAGQPAADAAPAADVPAHQHPRDPGAGEGRGAGGVPAGRRSSADFDTSLPEFDADPEQLTQAVLNIVRNAAQALAGTTAGPRDPPDDARRARRDAGAASATGWRSRVAIADNGPGVPGAIRDRIFFPLVSGREGGSGLGLTIAQTFVAQHDGTIECESVPGRTVFTILLPLEHRPRAARRPDGTTECTPTITNRRAAARDEAVWIVDDDRSIRWVLEKALAREGIPYKTFASAYEVLQALRRQPAAGAGLRHPDAGRIRARRCSTRSRSAIRTSR